VLSTKDNAGGWAIVSSLQFIDALASLRLAEDVEAAVSGSDVWIRSRNTDSAVLAAVASLPASQRFSWTTDNRLLPAGSRLATGRFPAADWHPFSRWLGVALPSAALPALFDKKLDLLLVPADQPGEPNALLTTCDIWANWASTAPAARLKPLKFAASFNQRILILGQPAPPIPGTRLIEEQGIICPAGFTWKPAVSPVTIREILGTNQQSYALWDQSGVQILAEELFVAASRSSANATLQGMQELAHE
jgi:hypothetical protein